MSELKEHLFCECDECIREYRGPLSNEMRPYYLKSDADKVIAELKDKAIQYKVLNKEHCRDLNTQERFFAKQIAHHKYKRCLAMAMWCESEAQKCLTQQSALIYFSHTDRFQYLQWYFTHLSRWHRIWLELAEKLKEAK